MHFATDHFAWRASGRRDSYKSAPLTVAVAAVMHQCDLDAISSDLVAQVFEVAQGEALRHFVIRRWRLVLLTPR